ncbi:ABC transporter ATP-binding protein [Brevibacillus dissolubilis]|uniref:ABC transporter ATP-binding protein n=1 Tax=Brevibacillus dissolubilis TaxID=1844116 RepID=UPI001116C840|nr:ABC transporter ATP-binding protein [Brevibacillus dissolubilis]
MTDTIIQTWNLTKQYDGKAGCREITLQVPRGVVFGFLGPNGAGKSTFVRTMMGLIHPTSGRAEMLGAPIGTIESRQSVGYLPELFRYPDWLTGTQLLESHAELCGLGRSERKKRCNDLIELVGLYGRGDEKIRGYSKGMQQRIGIACALVSDPQLVFFDEPTSALDPIGRKQVRELMRELRNQGKTVFLNSHLLSEVEDVCDHVAIIHKGEMVAQGEWRKLSAVKTQVEITVGSSPGGNPWADTSALVRESERLSATGERETWLITLADEDSIPDLVHLLSARGLSIYGVTQRQQRLEDVFFHYISQKEAWAHVDHRQNVV